jgi:Ca2+-binding EF-hand superfamily protein
MITTEEFGNVMQSLGQFPTDAELRDIRKKTDNATINFHSFLVMVAGKRFFSVREQFTGPTVQFTDTTVQFTKDQFSSTWGLG